MKGISAVIATILLLLIVIAIVGFAFGFFQRIFQTSATAGEQGVGEITGQLQQVVRIDNAAGTSASVRNAGSVDIGTGDLAFYINGALTGCAFAPNPATLAPGAVKNCTLASSCATGSTLKVTAPGSEHSVTCG